MSSEPIPNGLLNPDGSVTTFSGDLISEPSEEGAKEYERRQPIVNKFLNPDGSISTLNEILKEPEPFIELISDSPQVVNFNSGDYLRVFSNCFLSEVDLNAGAILAFTDDSKITKVPGTFKWEQPTDVRIGRIPLGFRSDYTVSFTSNDGKHNVTSIPINMWMRTRIGDVNNDGRVNSSDLMGFPMGASTLPGEPFHNADFNEDGVADKLDHDIMMSDDVYGTIYF